MWRCKAIALLTILNCVVHLEGTADSTCPFHLCTPENLRCRNQRLMRDDKGCDLCRCEEGISRPRPCPLHGCTVDLLDCANGLRKNADGCTLCECEESGNSTSVHQNANINQPATSSTETDRRQPPDETRVLPAECPLLTCRDTGCNRLVQNGCPTCECENDTSRFDFRNIDRFITNNEGALENPCPNANELMEGENMTRGVNRLQKGNNRAKYKLSIGRLRRGFTPGSKYTITLRSNNNNLPFKEYLFEVKMSTTDVGKVRVKRRRSKKKMTTRSMSSVVTNSESECEAGYLVEPKDDSSNDIWVFPRCPIAAVERNNSTNKTTVTVEWVAPFCGCVNIRVAVVDFTGQQVFFHGDSLLGNSTSSSGQSRTNRRNNPALSRTVCVKAGGRRRRIGSRTRQRKNKPVSSNFAACCQAGANTRNPAQCDRNALVYSIKKFYRFRVMKKTCKDVYKICCRRAGRLQDGVMGGRNSTRRHHRRTDSLNPRRNRPIGSNPQVTLPVTEKRRNRNRNKERRLEREMRRERRVRPRKERRASNNRRVRGSKKHK